MRSSLVFSGVGRFHCSWEAAEVAVRLEEVQRLAFLVDRSASDWKFVLSGGLRWSRMGLSFVFSNVERVRCTWEAAEVLTVVRGLVEVLRLAFLVDRTASEWTFGLSGGLRWSRMVLPFVFSSVGRVRCTLEAVEVSMVVRERWVRCSNLSFCCLLDSLDEIDVSTCWRDVFRGDFHLVEAWTICLSIPFDEVVVVVSAAACPIYPCGLREVFFSNGSSGILVACVGSLQKLKQYSFILTNI